MSGSNQGIPRDEVVVGGILHATQFSLQLTVKLYESAESRTVSPRDEGAELIVGSQRFDPLPTTQELNAGELGGVPFNLI
jgi:hypothetical protein